LLIQLAGLAPNQLVFSGVLFLGVVTIILCLCIAMLTTSFCARRRKSVLTLSSVLALCVVALCASAAISALAFIYAGVLSAAQDSSFAASNLTGIEADAYYSLRGFFRAGFAACAPAAYPTSAVREQCERAAAQGTASVGTCADAEAYPGGYLGVYCTRVPWVSSGETEGGGSGIDRAMAFQTPGLEPAISELGTGWTFGRYLNYACPATVAEHGAYALDMALQNSGLGGRNSSFTRCYRSDWWDADDELCSVDVGGDLASGEEAGSGSGEDGPAQEHTSSRSGNATACAVFGPDAVCETAEGVDCTPLSEGESAFFGAVAPAAEPISPKALFCHCVTSEWSLLLPFLKAAADYTKWVFFIFSVLFLVGSLHPCLLLFCFCVARRRNRKKKNRVEPSYTPRDAAAHSIEQ